MTVSPAAGLQVSWDNAKRLLLLADKYDVKIILGELLLVHSFCSLAVPVSKPDWLCCNAFTYSST
jgi:hypothetical protein